MGIFGRSTARTRSQSNATIFKPLWPLAKPAGQARSLKLSTCFEERFHPMALAEAYVRANGLTCMPNDADIESLLDACSPLETLATMTTAEGRRHRATRYNSVPAPRPAVDNRAPLTDAFAPGEETSVRSISADLGEVYSPQRKDGGAFAATPVLRQSPSNVVLGVFTTPSSPSFAASCVLPSYDSWVAGTTSMEFAAEVFSLVSLEAAKNTPSIRYRPEGFEMA